MKQVKILSEIEKILKENLTFGTSENETDTEEVSEGKVKKSRKKGPVKAIVNLLISFFVSVIKSPFELIHLYIKQEIVSIIRKELKSYFLLILLFGLLFTIFIVFWVLISLAFGVYFLDNGASLLDSVLYVAGIQSILFTIVSFIIYNVSKKIKSLKLLREPSN